MTLCLRSRQPRARAPASVGHPLDAHPTRCSRPTLADLCLAIADSFLNITKAATEKELSKAYRKRSLELQ